MKQLIVGLGVLLLFTGCATQVVPLNVKEIEQSERVRIDDLRPAVEKEGEIFSLMISSDAYAIYRLAEKSSAPTALRLLQHRFHEARIDVDPLEVKVHHLVVYQNLQSELRRGAIGAGLGGIVGAVIAAQTMPDARGAINSLTDGESFASRSESSEYQRALYSEDENPGRGSVFVVYIETEVNGKRVFTRTLAPRRSKDGESPFANALESAVAYHLAQR